MKPTHSKSGTIDRYVDTLGFRYETRCNCGAIIVGKGKEDREALMEFKKAWETHLQEMTGKMTN